MGYMRHHAIVVTGWDKKKVESAHEEARSLSRQLGVQVSELLPEATNGYRSFFVAPDGSKEGWTSSDLGDEFRQRFTAWLTRTNEGWGGTYLKWVEVQFGDDEGETKIIDCDDNHPVDEE